MMSNMNSTDKAVTVDHDDLHVFGNAFFEILNETTNGHADDTLPMAMALSVLDNGYGQSTMRLPIFSDMTSVVTPDMPIDDTTQDDDENDFSEETFSTVSDLSFDESHVHDNGDNDDDDDDEEDDDDEFDMDDEIGKITFDDNDEDNDNDVNKDDDKTQTTQWSFDLSFLLDNNVNPETATPVVQQQTVIPVVHNTATVVDTTANPVMAIIDLTDDETDTPHDRTVHTPIPVETAIPAAPMEIVEIPDDDDDNNNSTTLDAFAHDVMYAMDVSMDNLDNMRTAQLPAMTSIVAR